MHVINYTFKVVKSDLSNWKKKVENSKVLMPSPTTSSKFGLSILNFFKHAQFFMYTQNHFGILKS